MLLVETYVNPSTIQGLGLFAAESISRNTLIWIFNPNFDRQLTRTQILNFPRSLQLFIYRYAWWSSKAGHYHCSLDGAKYMNHSDKPNTITISGELDVSLAAIRDIEVGEEITTSHETFKEEEVADNGMDLWWQLELLLDIPTDPYFIQNYLLGEYRKLISVKALPRVSE